MIPLVAFLSLVGCSFTAPNAATDTPLVPMLDGRIVGGSEVDIANYPYQASLRYYDRHICGASIISANWVVSAAHCIAGLSASTLSLRAGSNYHDSGGTLHSISRAIAHTAYSSSTLDYDIAVLCTSSEFALGTIGIATVPLASSGSRPNDDVSAVVSGWGTTSPGSSILSSQLRAVAVPVVGQARCKRSYETISITDRMLCAGFSSGDKDSCQGDSGGPLVISGTLVGVVSWGRGCALANYPGVYASIGNLRNWISSNTGI